MKVLVIGATGLIAKPVIDALSRDGHSLKLFSRNINSSPLAEKFNVYQGDVFNNHDLKTAMSGCDAIHISASKLDEALAVEAIINEAGKQNIKLISYVSGSSVCEENRWFTLIDSKYRAEELLCNSGFVYKIFKPGWFYESLSMMIRNKKATVIGKKLPEISWLAGSDFGNLVAREYRSPEINNIQYALGPEKHTMKDLLTKYCMHFHPEIKKASVISTNLLMFIGRLSKNAEIKNAASLFRYFEKVGEPKVNVDTEILCSGFQDWIESQKSK